MPLCKDFEEKLIKHIWRTRKVGRRSTMNTSTAPSFSGSQLEFDPTATNDQVDLNEKAEESERTPATPEKRKWWSWRLQNRAPQSSGDPEKGASQKKPRKLILFGPVYAGCGAALAMCKSFTSTFCSDYRALIRN
jgi:hypothetical protein